MINLLLNLKYPPRSHKASDSHPSYMAESPVKNINAQFPQLPSDSTGIRLAPGTGNYYATR